MPRWLEHLRPHPTVPKTPWTAEHQWSLSLNRLIILLLGLTVFGLGDSLLIVSGLGNAPWSVLAQGFSRTFGISVGESTLVVSTVVLIFWIPLRQKPGFGTIANILVIAFAIDLGIAIFPKQDAAALRTAFVILGIIMVGVGSSLYITCGLGPGPRDGWMTAIHRRTGVPISRVRLSIELLVLILGWLLGGTVGVGTALFATLIGYSVALSFGVVSRLTHR